MEYLAWNETESFAGGLVANVTGLTLDEHPQIPYQLPFMTVRTLFSGDTFFLRTCPGGLFFSYVQRAVTTLQLLQADLVVDPEKSGVDGGVSYSESKAPNGA